MRGRYLVASRSLFIFIFDSKPTVSSCTYTEALLSTRTRSGRRDSPVIKDGDGKLGRSAYNELFALDERVLPICSRTEL